MSAHAGNRPSIGLLLLAGDTWWDMGVGQSAAGRYAGFMDRVASDGARARAALERSCRVVSSGIVRTPEAAAEGPMTLFNLTAERGGFKGGYFSGRCLGGPRMMEGHAQMLVMPDCQAEPLFGAVVQKGLFQHRGAAYGDIRVELSFLARTLGIDLADLGCGAWGIGGKGMKDHFREVTA